MPCRRAANDGRNNCLLTALRPGPFPPVRRPLRDFDPFNQMLAVNETAAHLELLVARQDLDALQDGTLRRYQLSTAKEQTAAVRAAGE